MCAALVVLEKVFQIGEFAEVRKLADNIRWEPKGAENRVFVVCVDAMVWDWQWKQDKIKRYVEEDCQFKLGVVYYQSVWSGFYGACGA
jgi:hypothetical protein